MPQFLRRPKDRFQLCHVIFVGDGGTVNEKNLEARELMAGAVRNMLCRSSDQARRDAARHRAVLHRLEGQLGQGGVKGLVTRSGSRGFLRVDDEEATNDPK